MVAVFSDNGKERMTSYVVPSSQEKMLGVRTPEALHLAHCNINGAGMGFNMRGDVDDGEYRGELGWYVEEALLHDQEEKGGA